MSILTYLIVPLLVAGEVEVSVTTADGGVIDGVVEMEEVRLRTGFGEAIIRLDAVASIDLGDPVVVVTTDQTTLRGRLDVPAFTIKTADGAASYPLARLKSLVVIQRPELVPGRITDGTARNRVTYHIRLPEGHRAGEPAPAVLILHGSNMNTRAYVESIVTAWPEIARHYILLGINGEIRNPRSAPDDPRYNYTYVNYVGRSRFTGYPGTDRESPALVAEVIEEIKGYQPMSRLFVGGHSQGGYLTYSIMMNFPELADGAFPVSAGLIIQCEPGAYDDADLIALQQATPLAIVHGTTDQVVGFGSGGRYAFEVFEDAGFPMVRLFADDRAGHRFSLLPVDEAIRWLEVMSADDLESLVRFAESKAAAGGYRDALAAIGRARAVGAGPHEKRLEATEQSIDAAAAEQAERLARTIETSPDARWVEEFLEFRSRFQLAPAAQPAIEAYTALRKKHQPEADRLFAEARGDFQRGRQQEGYAKYQRIVDELYASSWYRLAKRSLDDRE